MWLTMALYLFVGSFFGWALWVTSPSHPERLKRLRRTFGIAGDPVTLPSTRSPYR